MMSADKINAWFSVAKNFSWLFGLIALVAISFQSLDNRITRLEVDSVRISNAYQKQADQFDARLQRVEKYQQETLISITQIQTLLQERTSPSKP